MCSSDLREFRASATWNKMGKKKKPQIPEEIFHLPRHASLAAGKQPASIIDTHTHLLSTFETYHKVYPDGYQSYHDFVRGFYRSQADSASTSSPEPHHSVDILIDVWCEAPIDPKWKEMADSALEEQSRAALWGGVEYWFLMGIHPHNASQYTDAVEEDIINAMQHPRCRGWGEIGLDYHYMNSPAEVQKTVLRRQLKHAVALSKPITIHTREADEDIERIMKEEIPKDHKIHVHCFTDSPTLARNLLTHFPNLYIGITGVITYGTNLNTAQVIRDMVGEPASFDVSRLRIVLETDAPYMVPANIYESLSLTSGKSVRLALSHSGMIPWTAEFVASLVNVELGHDAVLSSSSSSTSMALDANDILTISRKNARAVYGV